MIERITSNLERQERGLELLKQLLGEEFSHLMNRSPQDVGGVEFSIQELLRQIAVEREELAALVQAWGGRKDRLSKVVDAMSTPEAEVLRAALGRISSAEQECAAQSAMNAETAIGLAEQNRELITFLQAEILPKTESTYSRNGRWHKESAASAVFRGRL
jgi:hypothetical protein